MKEENNTAKKDNNRTLCPQCKGSLQRNDIKQHILSCRKYIPTYLNNVRRFVDQISPNYAEFLIAEMDLIKEELSAGLGRSNRQSESKSDLKAEEKDSGRKGVKLQTVVKQEKIQQKSLVTKKFKVVKEKIKQNPTAVKNESLPKQQQIKEKISPPTSDKKIGKPIQHTIQLQDLFDYKQVKQLEDQGIPCADPTCTKPVSVNDIQNFTYLDECLHSICKYCFKNYVRNNYVKTGGELTCPNKKCKSLIPIMQIQDILDPDIFSKLEAQLNSKLISALVQCQKCHQHYHFEKGRPSDAPKSTQEGKPLPASMAKHYAENRFQCAKCKSDQCKACKAVPYHMGFNCEEYQEHKLKKKCRYCQKVLPKGYMSETGIKTFDDICDSAECQAQMRDACSKRLPCGHSCYGVIKEKNCLPCLNESCAKPNSSILLGQDETTFCSLCYIEALSEAPCVRSKCGHIFHLKCLNKRISLKWGSPRINFRFCQCPLCNAWIQLPLESEFTKTLQAFKTLQQNIEEKALKRLNHQGLTKDKQIMDPHSEYYNKPIKYAQTIYAYFQCYECHQPYFGGRKNCADAMNEGSQDKKFNPKELICPSCCPVQVNDCKKHGKEFISFKCRFCCTVAQWFCWGNTHFCDNCHRRQISGEYISRIPKDKLAQCEGKEKCPVGGEHGGNGEEFCLGCGVCRGDRIEAAHDF